jgi:hypothetical protein
MKSFIYYLSVLLFFFILLTSEIEYGTGSPGGKSGSPGDGGSTCTECHGGTASPQNGWITTSIPDDGYTPGETYTITATGTHNGVVKFGFEATAENTAGTKIGTLTITNSTETKLVNSNKAVTHKSAGTTPTGNTKSWSFNWTAPAAGTGNVGFYAAFNAANGNGNSTGDVIYKSSLTIPEFIAPQNGITVSLTGMTPHIGQLFEARLIDKSNLMEVERLVIDEITGASFEILFTSIIEGHSYWIDFYADMNGNGYYDAVPADHAWRLVVNNVAASNTIDFIYNTSFTEIHWKHMYEIEFHAMTPHIGQKLEVRLIDQTTGKEAGRSTLESIPSAEFSVLLPYIETGNNYSVNFYADMNGNGVYDTPPTDHAWAMELNGVEGDEDDDFTHNTNFTDIGWQYRFTLNATQMNPHLGQLFELRLVNQVTFQEAGRVTLDSIVLVDFAAMALGLELGESYFIDFYADDNGNGEYNPPPTDHAWRLELNNVTGDSELNFVHNTNFTDILWPFTSIAENTLADQVSVYPNPVIGELNVNLVETSFGATKVSLYNANGLLIETKPVAGQSGTFRIDMQQRSSGLYYLIIGLENGTTVTKSIIRL